MSFVLRSLILLLSLWSSFGAAPAAQTPASQSSPAVLEVFVREGCPHCAAAKIWLVQLARERPALQIVLRPVDGDPQARDALTEVSRAAGEWPPGVPTFVYRGQVLVGFGEAAESGPQVLALIDGAAPTAATQVESRLFGTLSSERLGLPLFTLALGLLDGFNPCAMWVLLFLLSLLLRLENRRRMALVAGSFVFVSGAMYFAFMATWLNVFLLVGWSNGLRVALALLALLVGALNVKDFLAFGRGPSLSIPASAKPGLYARMRQVIGAESLPAALLAVSALAIAVNFFELLCTAGIPAVYTAVLTQQPLTPALHYAYLGLYILAYIADDTLMVAVAVLALNSHKLTERGGRWLKLLSGAVMLALGLVMLLRPEWLI